ncbi:MAG TPA: AAA family ATPase, partial [Polyangiaceae bacterium]|nr:AAA family ATPase [Polyangiaceae bacterium]
FGLDHERLRDAGQSLLQGGGDVGESLFDAGAGGHGVGRVLSRLREESERLFKPRGGKQEIPQLLESFKAARERLHNATHVPEKYLEQQRELVRHREEHQALARELSEHRHERERSRLLQATLKGIAKRAKLLGDLDAIGAVPELPPDFGQRRDRVQGALSTHRANVERAERETARLTQRAAELRLPSSLLTVDEDTIASVREGIGSTKKALLDLPLREATLIERRAEAQAVERRIGLDSERVASEALKARRPEEAKFRRLLAERGALAERLRLSRERLAQLELDCSTRKAKLATLPQSVKIEALERAVALARHVGDVEGALAQTRRERAELELVARAELATLAPFNGSLTELVTLRVPATETVQVFEQRFAKIEEERRRILAELERCRERAAELSRELAAEEQAGAVPSESELERSRRTRDERFDELLRAWPESPAKGRSLFDAARLREYRSSVGAADALADRLRREAARVAENARRSAELTQLGQEQQRLGELTEALSSERDALEREWASSWAAAGFQPVRPSEMRGWLARRERAVAHVTKEAAVVERERSLEAAVRELSQTLRDALDDDQLPVAVRAGQAAEKLDRERRLENERRALELQIAELEVRLQTARQELQASETEAQQRELELAAVIQSLGFESGIAPEQVEARLEALNELVATRQQTSELERRIAGMRRDIAAFEAQVQALVQSHAPDLAELPSAHAAAEIYARFERGRRDAENRARIEEDLRVQTAELEEERAALTRAESEAVQLLAMAGARDAIELPGIELRVAKARELRAELDGLEASLGATAGPRGLNVLLEEAAATDPARLSARLEELERLIEELEERHSESIRAQQRVQAGLELYSDASAAEAAAEERLLASALVVRAERWAKFKLAEVLLAKEIERYREQNQGPVLRRAAELFVKLTHGQFRGLRLGREERTLLTVRANEQEVGVEGLNEAARYHLYLALRLASLERYLEHAEPLPLVLDDVLIHFDDDGARAALGVLAELSDRIQVLLFTHHRHNLALAESTSASGRLFIHEL